MSTTPPHTPQDLRAASLQSHFANLSQGPLTTHLTDTNSIPILSTHPSPTNSGLSSLSNAFIQAHDTASRMGLGHPLRVTIATASGAAVIQTATGGDDLKRHRSGGGGEMLVGTVIAPADRLAEARIASWGIEEVARRFQKSAGEGL